MKYEYTTCIYGGMGEDPADELNRMGREGWRLVGILEHRILILERSIIDAPPPSRWRALLIGAITACACGLLIYLALQAWPNLIKVN